MMKLNKLKLKDKPLFDRFLGGERNGLSVYSFANIFIWTSLFDIFWLILDDHLCLFLKDKFTCFMYLPPLGKSKSQDLIKMSFSIMDKLNPQKKASRIENVQEEDLNFYRRLGYQVRAKPGEYVYKSEELALLKGEPFKTKRWAHNYFLKHYNFSYQPFSLERDRDQCLSLCREWVKRRKKKYRDPLYRYMLDDSIACQRIALDRYKQLGLSGRVVRVNNLIKAYTLGFQLKCDTFCILFEVTDLSVKGIAQFIFREFCAELKDYRYINVMDDSGLESLKKLKLSYRPHKTIASYIIERK